MEGIADISARLAATSDEEVMRLYAAMRMTKATRRWAEIAAAFPEIDRDHWPIDYAPVLAWREATEKLVTEERLDPAAIKAWYRDRPKEFIEHWGTTYDPRNAGTTKQVKMPMLLFKRQREFIDFLGLCLTAEAHGLAEKVRDFGATWLCAFFSIQLWVCVEGSAVGWGSRKEELVDKIGDPDSIFEKIRIGIRALPWFLLPSGFIDSEHLTFMKCVNADTGATITGECGDNIGRGGRSLIYFKDESAHYARPDKIEAALADNTRVQIDISTPNGLGNVFHRRREAGEEWRPGQPIVKGKANVFIMDWREHPGKTKAWYDERRAKAVAEGLLHVFKQEVERDYAASVEGIIIRPEWIRAAIDAHVTLGFDDSGGWSGGLDVADGESGDGNGLAAFKGVVLRMADAWGDVDAGVATRRAIQHFQDLDIDVQYDSVGVGAAVKAEANRLAESMDEDGLPLLPEGIRLIPWSAGAGVLSPDDTVNPDDRDSPTNKNMFANLKAQAWWMVARRFEKTYRAIEEGITYDSSELISIDSTIPLLRQVEKELAQPTMKKRPGDMKLIVDKAPDGTKSPNIGDAIIMAAFPVTGLKPVFRTAAAEFAVSPFALPKAWARGCVMKVTPERVYALWGAWDHDQHILYVTTEHSSADPSPAVHAAAIKARGEWIPVVIESEVTNLDQRREQAAGWNALGLDVMIADKAFDAGIADMANMLSTARMKVFTSCQRTLRDYRNYRRTDSGEVVGGGLMDCARLLCRPSTIQAMRIKPVPVGQKPGHVGDRRMAY